MSRFRVGLLPAAEAEAREAFRWDAARSLPAAVRFRAQVIDTIDALADEADRWGRTEMASAAGS